MLEHNLLPFFMLSSPTIFFADLRVWGGGVYSDASSEQVGFFPRTQQRGGKGVGGPNPSVYLP